MIISRLSLKGFKNFKEESNFKLEKINLISGENGSGKSTLAVDSVLFVLFGYSSQTLEKLVTRSLKKKECKVRIEIEEKGKKLIIERCYPTSLTIFENGVKLDFPNTKETQEYLNSLFGSLESFRKFRMIDSTEGINILEEGKTSLKKTLLSLEEDWINKKRQKLLDKKRIRETFNIDKRLYKFYLSEKRLQILEDNYVKLLEESKLNKINTDKQQEVVNGIKIEKLNGANKISSLQEQIYNSNISIAENAILIEEYKQKIETLKKQPLKDKVIPVDYDSKIESEENEILILTEELEKVKTNKDNFEKVLQKSKIYSNEIINEIDNLTNNIITTEVEIEGLEGLEIGTKCDKCGSLVTQEHKDKYKKEKKDILKELIEKRNNLNNKIVSENKKIAQYNLEITLLSASIRNIEKTITEDRINIKKFNEDKFKQAKKIEEWSKQQLQISSEIDKCNEFINIYNKQNTTYKNQIEIWKKELIPLNESLKILSEELIVETESLNYCIDLYNKTENKLQKTFQRKNQLKEAFKFIEYKYNRKDVLIIDKCVKELDNFYGYFITEWIKTLEPIINNVLDKIGFKISFKDDFDIILHKDNETYSYKDLSTGQKLILSIALKLAILLERGEVGVVIADEGFSSLSEESLTYILQLFRDFPFQLISIIHRFSTEEENINTINL